MKKIVVLLFTLAALKGFSCSCSGSDKISDNDFKSYDLILKGRIEKVTEGKLERSIYVRVEKQYKGNTKKEIVVINSSSLSGMCGIFPEVGETWLMFARKSQNSFFTDLCTRTKNMNPKALDYNKKEIDSDLAYLENRIIKK